MSRDFVADIHCHSVFSDGSDTPIELVQLAQAKNLLGISITDHDTIDAYTPEVLQEAKERNIVLLPGIELSTQLWEEPVHVLGYGFQLDSGAFQQFIQSLQERRNQRNIQIIEKLQGKHLNLTLEEVQNIAKQEDFPKKVIGRPHIAALMIQKGYVKSIAEAFRIYLGEKGSCYVAVSKMTPLDAIQAIHAAKGKAVLAHPHFIRTKKVLSKLYALPFDGLECDYGDFSVEQNAHFAQKAKKLGWMVTGGSDYHGTFKPRIQLGISGVNSETFQKLLS